MVPARLLCALLSTLVLVTAAHASTGATTAAPTGLRGFLFRADEPVRREFARTPSFAWSPVAGATGYEFELATSSAFRDNAIVFADRDLKSPVASVELTLPWITGSPYSLYARVRAVKRSGAGAWSEPFGFNLRQTDVPKPSATQPGLLRWTPIEGANGYEVWLIDLNEHVVVSTNVLDQREFYSFHQSDPWVSNVRWRIRALRSDISPATVGGRANGMPAVAYGPWSPVYESKNPSFATGPLRLVGTISDVVTSGRSTDPAHRLMPSFVFAGNQTSDGTEVELFRVYAFSDRDCINPVFTGSVVGSPAYAPRPYGPMSLPQSVEAVAAARGQYATKGDQGVTFSYDERSLKPTESEGKATPTTGLPSSKPATPDAGSSGGSSTGLVTFLKVDADYGAPIELWDTNWPEGGYYWTVVGVRSIVAATASTTLTTAVASGATTIEVAAPAGFAVGDVISIGSGTSQELATISAITGSVFTLTLGLRSSQSALATVSRAGGNLRYQDAELPQEVCAEGRVLRFGKSSEPALVSAGTPFASGLSPRGRLTTATGPTTAFYGSPLVAWTPALGANAYHVQWSKTRSPFKPVNANWQDKGEAPGFLTFASSAVLPLSPGTWWYRVRGISYNLPTNAQFMGWSDPARIVVSKPTFAVAKPKAKTKKKKKKS